MRLQALVRDPQNNGELINIYLDECHYWKCEAKSNPRRIIYYHMDGMRYEGVAILDDFEESDQVHSMGVWRIDNSNYVNISHITEYDKKRGEVYFNDEKVPAASCARIYAQVVDSALRIKRNMSNEYKVIDKVSSVLRPRRT